MISPDRLLALGSALWGKVATFAGLPVTLFIAAAGALLIVPLLWRWKLQTGAELDLAPSLHWPEPSLSRDIKADRGPVLVSVEYRIKPESRAAFLDAMNGLASERRRDGAFEWGLFEDVALEGRFVETFLLDSWVEHLRQHERVTNADRVLQDAIYQLQQEGSPKVSHLVAPTHF